MAEDLPIRQPSLTDQVFEILIHRIVSGDYSPGELLPSEGQLAEELNVSRSTVRAAFMKLEDRRLVQRRQGVGTFISKFLSISNPLNQFIEFPRLIRENGFEPGFQQISARFEVPDEEVCSKLHLEPDQSILVLQKIFTADGDPIIYVENQIPEWILEGHLTREEALKPGITNPFMEFFEERCKQKISHFVSTVRSEIFQNINAPEGLANQGPNTPVLVIDEVGYNVEDQPVLCSQEYHPGNRMQFQFIRRRNGF